MRIRRAFGLLGFPSRYVGTYFTVKIKNSNTNSEQTNDKYYLLLAMISPNTTRLKVIISGVYLPFTEQISESTALCYDFFKWPYQPLYNLLTRTLCQKYIILARSFGLRNTINGIYAKNLSRNSLKPTRCM